MIRTSFVALLMASAATAAAAQDPHAGHAPAAPAQADPHAGHIVATPPAPAAPINPHAGHMMPSAAAPDPHAGHAMPAESAKPAPTAPAQADPHAGHAMAPQPALAAPGDPHAGHMMPPTSAAAPDPHAGHDMSGTSAAMTGAQLPVGAAPPPPAITDSVADGAYGAAAMDRARRVLQDEHGGARLSKVQADVLEWAPSTDGYSWQAEGWWGGDINRMVVKTEGEGQARGGVETAEVQALYSRAVARYTDVQVGLRVDIEPRSRAYATAAIDTMVPYWFEAEGAVFLSDKGDLLARLEGSYDLRMSQKLILQPRVELSFAAQKIPEADIDSGLSTTELGLRLGYEIRREFAPYIGVSYERAHGGTARLHRAKGEDVESTKFTVGIRAWF